MSRAAMTTSAGTPGGREFIDDVVRVPCFRPCLQPTIDRVVVHVAPLRLSQFRGGRPLRFTEGSHEGRPLGVGLDGEGTQRSSPQHR